MHLTLSENKIINEFKISEGKPCVNTYFHNSFKGRFLLENNYFKNSCWKTKVDKNILFDERYFLYLEDLDFCIRLSSVGYIGVVHKALALHGHEQASRKNINLLLIHLRSFLYFWYKHGFFLKR